MEKYTVYNRTTLEHYDTNDYSVAWARFRIERDKGCEVEIVDNEYSEVFASTSEDF